MIIRNLFCTLLLFISFNSLAQKYGGLIIYPEINFDGAAYTIEIFKNTSALAVLTRTYNSQEEIELDSIEAGMYRLVIKETHSTKLFFSREVDVVPNDVTRLYVDLNISETKDLSDTLKYNGKKADGELNFGYQNGRLTHPNSVFLNGFMIGIGGHYWKAKYRHLATVFGFGFNYRRNKISGDTSFIAAPLSYKKTEEVYNYLDAHFDFKIRVCGANQQLKSASQNFIVDLGAIYNLPLYFRYRGNYEGNKTIQASGIHQYTDLRAFVNVGFYPLLFFYEYRLSNFIIGNYPEMPRSTFGIRLLLTPIIN